jgi:hypothetical protein
MSYLFLSLAIFDCGVLPTASAKELKYPAREVSWKGGGYVET